MFTVSNTHILAHEFEYLEPHTGDEVVAMLTEHGSEAQLMAGGTDVLVQMKLERRLPRWVVSLRGVGDLRRIRHGDGLELGATASVRRVAAEETVRSRYTALAEACRSFSTVQIMAMATIGGNLCNASPAADTAPALLAFGAQVRLVSAGSQRDVPLDEFFVGPGRTVLRTAEFLESIRVPATGGPAGSAFLKISRVEADISKVCVAVMLVREAARVRACRIALGAVAPRPCRARRAEAVILEGPLTARAVDEAARLAREAIEPITDVRSSEAYRRHVAGVLVGDAVRRAWARAGGGELR
jgi:CO/xanthine dehydrogenase FAD-binding subunit